MQVWIGDAYEEKNGKVLFHIGAAGKKVCTFDSTGTNVFEFYHGDHLRSTTVLTDKSGNRIQHHEYSAFGRDRYTESTTAFALSHRFTSQVLDEQTGLYYYNARYYDPELGRFIQPDTIIPDAANPQSLNRYSYTLNNPLKFADPDGHQGKFNEGTPAPGLFAPTPAMFDAAAAAQEGRVMAQAARMPSAAQIEFGDRFITPAVDFATAGLANQASIAFSGQDFYGNSYGARQRWAEGISLPKDVLVAGAMFLPGGAAGRGASMAERIAPVAKTTTQLEFGFARGASIQTPRVTTAGETFVRVGAVPENLNFGLDSLSGARPRTYAFPEATFNAIGQNPAALKNFGDLPGAAPQYFRVLQPPAGTPIQRGIVPGGQNGGVGGAGEVFFPKGF